MHWEVAMYSDVRRLLQICLSSITYWEGTLEEKMIGERGWKGLAKAYGYPNMAKSSLHLTCLPELGITNCIQANRQSTIWPNWAFEK